MINDPIVNALTQPGCTECNFSSVKIEPWKEIIVDLSQELLIETAQKVNSSSSLSIMNCVNLREIYAFLATYHLNLGYECLDVFSW